MSSSGTGDTNIPALGDVDDSTSVVISNDDVNYGLLLGTLSSGDGWIQAQRTDGTATGYNLLLQPNAGNVGIGTTTPDEKLTVDGNISVTGIIIDGTQYKPSPVDFGKLKGLGFSIPGIGTPTLTAMDSTHVAFIDTTLEKLRTYAWNGATWSLVGSEFSIPGIGTPTLTAMDSTHVAFIDTTLDELRTYESYSVLKSIL